MNLIKLRFSLLILLSADCCAQPTFVNHNPVSLDKSRLYIVTSSEIVTYVTGLSFLSFVWYKDHERTPFHYYNDLKGYLQMDKSGHAYSAYHQSSIGYHALRWAGLDKKKSLILGGPLGLIFQTPIEVYDGLYEGWGFSWWDMAANTFGSALFTVQEACFNDQIIKMKFSYSPSGYPKYHAILGENHMENFFLDYNGHTYWLSGNLQRLTGFKIIPAWLNLAFGYSGNGMIKEFENPKYYRGKAFPYLDRYRQWLFSADIDLTKIKTNKKWISSVLKYANMLKIPFPALEINRIEGVKLRPFYF